jgi:hypothetical protein
MVSLISQGQLGLLTGVSCSDHSAGYPEASIVSLATSRPTFDLLVVYLFAGQTHVYKRKKVGDE